MPYIQVTGKLPINYYLYLRKYFRPVTKFQGLVINDNSRVTVPSGRTDWWVRPTTEVSSLLGPIRLFVLYSVLDIPYALPPPTSTTPSLGGSPVRGPSHRDFGCGPPRLDPPYPLRRGGRSPRRDDYGTTLDRCRFENRIELNPEFDVPLSFCVTSNSRSTSWYKTERDRNTETCLRHDQVRV